MLNQNVHFDSQNLDLVHKHHLIRMQTKVLGKHANWFATIKSS